ncbi:MAG: DNA protecting protein DprA [Candidatus Taylorbacteria bacterium RIFCSPHIGHO2_02_FULL_44_36]|uniref:DNA protecting protein DprA n=1 Tax=Candidatus Taylorbacteria bacterium RIFCSPLOWO2_12_FULL_44_15c TaxID=1802333 RepID=A0A1G2P4H3_9BACT|nr:MAG: DNA protecting protein DprA [Candidatus Taylorbacteria bacterium RIFCSPHIGHO2_02_FULL_44_36]OHA39370.1 MAG: DNA protecting protein DprA [Candidatus Taylorbacteria bacterium RIFCSPLOWO2_02_FULL_44_35]OHA43240.1 MAG: DNA protecting protein DprA [Candidatus Taylorbacteria bacterium RIFCSPLOWO2_12_FULL_44_15c]
MKIKVLKSENWSPLLKEIPDPPEKLYIRGALPDWSQKFLCVVGARRYTSYGKEACEKLIAGLRGYPIIIVSGLALGIDSIAHRAALAAGLKTLAVPGSGLLPEAIHPRFHRQLAEKIIEAGGALLSEFEPDFRATLWAFPQRNRIMAGLANATLVVEAEKKSGTLITAKLATEYNRDVLTIPGSIFSPNSEGPHLLIRLGATPVTSPAELLEALGFKTEAENSQAQLALAYADCSSDERKILELLREPLARDILISRLGFPASRANALLSVLEIKGLIKESLGELHLA